MKFIRFLPTLSDGLAFPLGDLRMATEWAKSRPSLQLRILWDRPGATEIIEIQPAKQREPRWRLWRTHEGRLMFDDYGTGHFGLPHHTIKLALSYIVSKL